MANESAMECQAFFKRQHEGIAIAKANIVYKDRVRSPVESKEEVLGKNKKVDEAINDRQSLRKTAK